MNIVLLHNTNAGDQKLSREDLAILLRQAGYEPRTTTLKEAGANPELLLDGEFVAVAGGDGSMRKAALLLVGTSQSMAPIPLGTANNIARSLGIRGEPHEVIAGWARGRKKKIDMGSARGPWGRHLFLEGVGIGLIGRAITIIEGIDAADPRGFKTSGDKLRRDLSVLVALAHDLPAVPLKLAVDGRDASGDFIVLEIMNIGRAGPAVKIANHTDMSDGFLDLVVARSGDRQMLLKNLHGCLGDPDHKAVLSSHKVRHLKLTIQGGEFRLDDAVILKRDDVVNEGSEIEIEVVPNALNVLLPETIAPEET
ncbi:MAG TPA: diacylglycerol kinase family protein [Lacunisphaera sp.]|jgi:diacylglycerol kinase family enzyme